MCLRFTLAVSDEKELKQRFDVERIEGGEIKARYNISPTQNIAVVCNDSSNSITFASWGLIPHWAKEEKMGSKLGNARAESVDKKPAFKKPFESKRCLIIADSFYEWKKPAKTPYRIMLKNERLFAFAGIYDDWRKTEEGGGEFNVRTCSIITTEPNALVKEIHDRMPVILKREDEKKYLDASVEEAKGMLAPYPAERMRMYEVSRKVNSSKFDSPDLIEPVKKTKKGTLEEFV